jgi:hypothetical protein
MLGLVHRDSYFIERASITTSIIGGSRLAAAFAELHVLLDPPFGASLALVGEHDLSDDPAHYRWQASSEMVEA